MTIQQFIDKAIEGGWMKTYNFYGPSEVDKEIYVFTKNDWTEGKASQSMRIEKILLDPEAWKAVGKVEGWKTYSQIPLKTRDGKLHKDVNILTAHLKQREMLDALWYGRTIEQYLETL